MNSSEGTTLELVESPLQQITKGEMATQMEVARQYPRDLSLIKQEVKSLATLDQETAADCFFSLKRGGKVITGESVRLAEILVSCYGNLKAGSRPVAVNLVRGIVTVQGYCFDLQKNTVSTIEKERKVQRKKWQKEEDPYDEDMINLAVNAACAIAYRDAVFKIVPKAIIKPILKDIREAARGKGTLEEKRQKVINRLVQLGVEEKRIYPVLEIKGIDDIDLPMLDLLIGMGVSLSEGHYTKDDMFPPVQVAKPKSPKDKEKTADNLMGKKTEGADEIPMGDKKEEKSEQPEGASAATTAAPAETPEASETADGDGGGDDSGGEHIEHDQSRMPDDELRGRFKAALKENDVQMAHFAQWADANKHGRAKDWTYDVMVMFVEQMANIKKEIAQNAPQGTE